MKIVRAVIFFCFITTCAFGLGTNKKSPFSFKENDQGIKLFENGKTVLFYQRKPKSITGEYVFINNIHPLYSIEGDKITKKFLADYLFYRVVFWACHQIFIKNRSVSDEWVMSGLCLQEMLNYPAPWIIRQATSMQNIVSPGRKRVALPLDKPILLKYCLVIHNGNASSIKLEQLE